MAGLSDLPTDALLHLLSLLPPRDSVRLGSTCRLLRSCSSQDAVWQHQCEVWLDTQRSQGLSNGLAAVTSAGLRSALGLPSYRALFTAIWRLGSWPAGLFYAVSEQALPRGNLLVCHLHPTSGQLCLQRPTARPLDGPPGSPLDCWEVVPSMDILVAPAGDGGKEATVEVRSTAGLHCSLQLSLDGQTLRVHRSRQPRPVLPAPGTRTLPSSGAQQGGASSQALAYLAVHLGFLNPAGLGIQVESIEYRRVPMPVPRDLLPAAGEPPGMSLLRRCQGVYFASYGPHGLEVLRLSASCQQSDVPPLCPVTGPRLQALKLRGDPNVPALKHSFVVDAASLRLGPYDPGQDDPLAPPGGPARPCLSFFQGHTQLVSLEERPVAARFSAVGCINVVPGEWDPEWVPATFLLYSGTMERTLTVVFEDAGQPFRHAMDFQEFPFGGEFAGPA